MVLLSGKDLEDAARLITVLTEGSDAEVVGFNAMEQPQAITRETLLAAARRELRSRRLRSKLLPDGMFGEPAWEILLQLYVEQQGIRQNIARLSGALAVPQTSVIRWLSYLQDRDLVRREAHPTDQRSVYLELTSKGIEALDAYLSETLARGA